MSSQHFSKNNINIESRLVLEILSESKNTQHHRRYVAVQRYIKTYGILPRFDQIIRELPKQNYFIQHVVVPSSFTDEIAYYEELLVKSPDNVEIVAALDRLYDSSMG